jgi:hypothetical protein
MQCPVLKRLWISIKPALNQWLLKNQQPAFLQRKQAVLFLPQYFHVDDFRDIISHLIFNNRRLSAPYRQNFVDN